MNLYTLQTLQTWTHRVSAVLLSSILLTFAVGWPTAQAQTVNGEPAPTLAGMAGLVPEARINDYRLGPGDNIRILVFQNPDLTLDTRVAEGGTINYPLVGTVAIGGLTIGAAERRIATALKSGNFLKLPQVNIVLLQVRGNQVSVLGQVNRPGRFPLETFNTRLSGLLATAGGIANGPTGGADRIVLVGMREGQPFRKEIDVTELFSVKPAEDIEVAAGDVIYVPPAPLVYVYGEVQRPGSFRLKRGMTVQQALADGGGLTPRGSYRGLRLDRRDTNGRITSLEPTLDDLLRPDDVLVIRESLF